jgi:hypothetical protein
MLRITPERILCSLWVLLLAASFFVCARSSYRQSLSTEEFAYGCDPFGYLYMAKQIRHAVPQGAWPEFKIESTQTRTLINYMQQQNIALPRWDEIVAPHAHHYFPKSGYVGVQYPPGTGLVLAMFPQGEAVYRLNRLVVVVFVAVGIVALIIALHRSAWTSTGLVVLALNVGLLMLARMDYWTYSINAVLVPALMTCLFSLFALRFQNGYRDRLALLCAFVAGLFLGFAMLIRLPAFLMLPGFLVLLWPGLRNLRLTSLPVLLVAGVVITGVIPVLINQQNVAGAWYLSTYASVDAAPPTLRSVPANISYFLGNGHASVDNWALLFAIVGFAGFLILHLRSKFTANRLGLSWKRLALSALLLWLVPICYFLTHAVTGPHYMMTYVFASIAVLGFGAFGMEATSDLGQLFDRRKIASWVAIVLILWPGLAGAKRVWSNRVLTPAPSASTREPMFLPSELMDEKAWVSADLFTGALWYYASKPAFKMHFTDEEVRKMLFRFVQERGEHLYVVRDSGLMITYLEEIERFGGKLEFRGLVGGQPFYLVTWPNGPAVAQAR